jgi:HlyD family secretion protein
LQDLEYECFENKRKAFLMFKTMQTMFQKPSFSGIRRNPFFWIVLAVLLVSTGGIFYYKLIYLPNKPSNQIPVIQTAIVRQGDLIISASGTGTLTAAKEINLAFTASGKVTKLLVKAGDQVKEGELLAEVDSPDAQANYTKAQNKYRELTSAAAIASAQAAVAQAQIDVYNALNYLGYLISPEALYWETEKSKAEQTLKEAHIAAEKSPADENALKKLKDAEAYLSFAQSRLSDAQVLYTDEYVLKNFVVRRNGRRTLSLPTDMQIHQARIAIDEARTHLKESIDLYNVLTGGPTPEDVSSSALIELQQAKLDLQNAQAVLDGAKITAPFSGTIMAVNTSLGNIGGTGTTIVIADLSQPYLEIYLDSSDWGKAVVGNNVNITFDALPDRVFTGQVTGVDKALSTSSNSSVVKGTVSLAGTFTDINLPMGTSASVEVISEQVKNAVLIPVEALHEISPGQYAVFVIENNQPQLRMIEVGLKDEVYAEVKSGLNVGEVVATGGVKVQ